mmetsp:Transcript_18324/g.30101  ORF Transcript_18324/g.30101 Transcript_18324/m.30101 type:complete len:105 (-) Transcript_18324:109-423(-)
MTTTGFSATLTKWKQRLVGAGIAGGIGYLLYQGGYLTTDSPHVPAVSQPILRTLPPLHETPSKQQLPAKTVDLREKSKTSYRERLFSGARIKRRLLPSEEDEKA